ncbi:DNA cytosine methyltransferase [Erythrobacter sp. LQ02-29]|uniref:DNA cytosine methyltransferase n=1 Tax=Erythrobacter sp. LQ02-29 TaxID=2920384 RepID=UPI00358F2977
MASHTEPTKLLGISLCAGYAGLDLGISIAEPQYRTVCYVEREAHAAATLVARMEDEALDQAPIWDDLKSFDGRAWRDRVHILSAGYPCQPFSVSGKRRAEDDPRHLWPEVARIIDEVRPSIVFAENVEGHIDLGFAEVATCLQDLGFDTKAGLFTAREVGARHRRRRLFIMADADRHRCRVLPRTADRFGKGITEEPVGHRSVELGPVLAGERSADLDLALAPTSGSGGKAERPLPLFAPGPGELEAWEDLLRKRPDLQPALLRAHVRMADRLDRTRGVGNGVSSLAAAYAWRTLRAAFM